MELPSKEELLQMCTELFRAHVCERFGGCGVCSTWLTYAEKFGWSDRYPNEHNWSWDNVCEYCKGYPTTLTKCQCP